MVGKELIRAGGQGYQRPWFALFAVLILTGCQNTDDTFTFPAEWEPHDAVWLTFLGGPMDDVAFTMAEAIAPHAIVKAVVPGTDVYNRPTHRLAYEIQARFKQLGIPSDRIDVIRSDTLVQTRDTGPIFVKNDAGDLRIVDFRWNNYGDIELPPTDPPNRYSFAALMAERLALPTVRSSIVMEGGAFDVNGKGTILQVESVTLQRNPGLSKAEIEAELKRVLGQEKVIWLKEGPAEDANGLTLLADRYLAAGVGGHVDEFVRFVNPTTILLAMPDSAEAANNPIKQITYDRMQVNYEILKSTTDQDGNPFEIITVPVPDVVYEPLVVDQTWAQHPYFGSVIADNLTLQPGDTLQWVPASSYLNYFVTNNVVIIPSYWQPGLPESVRAEDNAFRMLLAQFYPNRAIVAIDPLLLNNAAGGLHCWTQQQPAVF